MKRFLRYITEQVIEGRGARLKGYTIGLEVFDRPDDFDPQSDTIVRVQAGQLRRRLDLYYAELGKEDPVRLTVPKGRYAPNFEFRTGEAESGPVEEALQRPLLSLLPGGGTKERPGLAVITFDDLTVGEDSDFFAEGLTAEVVGALVQFRHLRVVAVRPTVSDRENTLKVRDVGRLYDAQFVLSGSVRRAGDVFRVSVNLINTETGQILFGQTFDRQYTPDNVFAIQESIASNVAAAIAAPFGQVNRFNWRTFAGRRHDIDAYEIVLRYYSMGLSPSLAKTQAMLEQIAELTRKNPTFSTGLAIRALLHVLLCTQCIPAGNKRENLDAAQELATRAVQLDSQNALAHFAAFQGYYHDGQHQRAEKFAQQAMVLNPNDYNVLAYLALTQALRGETEVSEAYDESAHRLIAIPPRWFSAARLTRMLAAGKYQAALDDVSDINASHSVSLWFLKLSMLGHLGMQSEGRDFYQEVSPGPMQTLDDWAHTLHFWQPDPELEARIVEGWRKVGLDR